LGGAAPSAALGAAGPGFGDFLLAGDLAFLALPLLGGLRLGLTPCAVKGLTPGVFGGFCGGGCGCGGGGGCGGY